MRQEFEFHPNQVKFISQDGMTEKNLSIDDNGHFDVSLSRSKYTATSTASTTSSTTYVPIDSTASTPEAGTWLVMFSSSGKGSVANSALDFAVHVDGTIVSDSQRKLGYNSGGQNMDTVQNIYTQAVVTTTGIEVVDVRYKTSSGTFTIYERNIILLRLG